MKSKLFYFSILILFSIHTIGSNKDSTATKSKYFSVGYSLNIIDMLPAQLSLSYDLSSKFSVTLIYGHLFITNNSLNKQNTFFESVTNQGLGKEDGSMYASTRIANSNYLKLTFLKTLSSHKNKSYLDIGLFYSLAKTTQELTLEWYQSSAYGKYNEVHTSDYYYNNVGITLIGHAAITEKLYFSYGSEIYIPINTSKVFDDVIQNYYLGSTYTPGQGFAIPFPFKLNVPIALNIGLAYRIPFKRKINLRRAKWKHMSD